MTPGADVVADLSAYLIAGRVVSHAPRDAPNETAVRTVAQGIEDGVQAERLGFRAAYLSERWNLKEAGVVLGAVGARTERIGLGTGLVSPARRHVLHMAALGATMHAAFGPRFVLGLGRGDHAYLRHEGLRTAGFTGVVDHVKIMRRLWDGETVTYDGPAGSYREIKLGDVYQGPPPRVFYGTFGLPRAAAAVAEAFDGVILPPMMTPEATARSVRRLRDALAETQRTTGDELADTAFHRIQLLEAAELVPDEWMTSSCALGTATECAAAPRAYRDAGADEVTTYGSTPAQNAGVIEAWRGALAGAGR